MSDSASVSSVEPIHQSGWKSVCIVLSMCVAVFTIGLMSTGVIDAMVKMRDALNLSPSTLQWLMNAYLLTAASFVIISGRVSEIYGRRNVLILGMLIFIAGLIVTACSGDGSWVIVGRAVQGVGAAVVAPGTMAILRLKLPPNRQAFAVTTWSASAGLGFSFGPIIGGALTDGLSWRYLFWLSVLLLVISLFLLFLSSVKNKPAKGRQHIDWLGAVLLILFTVPLFLGLVQGNAWGWGYPWTWGLLIFGAVFFVILLWVELAKKEPLVLFRLFVDRQFAMGAIGMIFNGFNLLTILYFASLYLQMPFLKNFSPVRAGVALLPFSIGFFMASISASFIIKKLNFRFSLLLSGLLQCGGFLWLCFITPSTTYLFLWAPYLLIGLGSGFNMATFPVLAMLSVPDEHANKASGFVNMTNYLGATLSPAIGTIFFVGLSTSMFLGMLEHMPLSAVEAHRAASALFGHVAVLKHVVRDLAPHARFEVVAAMQHSALVGKRAVMIISSSVGLIMALLPLMVIPRKR
jgi:MFS family permease